MTRPGTGDAEQRAIAFAARAHVGQRYDDGPYTKHLAAVRAVLKLADRIANVEASATGSRYLATYTAEQPAFEAMIAEVGLLQPIPLMLARLQRAFER